MQSPSRAEYRGGGGADIDRCAYEISIIPAHRTVKRETAILLTYSAFRVGHLRSNLKKNLLPPDFGLG